jgi:hypothetical protein
MPRVQIQPVNDSVLSVDKELCGPYGQPHARNADLPRERVTKKQVMTCSTAWSRNAVVTIPMQSGTAGVSVANQCQVVRDFVEHGCKPRTGGPWRGDRVTGRSTLTLAIWAH